MLTYLLQWWSMRNSVFNHKKKQHVKSIRGFPYFFVELVKLDQFDRTSRGFSKLPMLALLVFLYCLNMTVG